MSPAPTRAELLESEKSLMKPAGIAALAGVVLFVISAFIQSSVGGDVDTDADLLRQYAEDGGTLLIGRIVFGLSFLCFTLPFYVLFRACQARADRIRNSFVAFCFIGPVLLAVQSPLLSVGYQDAGEKFVDQAPGLEREQPAGEDAKPADGTTTEQDGTTTSEDGTTTSEDGEEDPDEADTPEENLAEELIEDNGTIKIAQPLLLPALLGMVTLMIFVNLWALRTGLLSRFWASFGIALGAAMIIILPIALLGIVVWMLSFGMLLLDFGRRERPPAWAAGVAMPWPRPGEPPPDGGDGPGGPGGSGPGGGPGPGGPGGALEGSGRDVSGDAPETNGTGQNGRGEMPDPGDEPGGNGPELPPGPTYPPRKRKRRG